MLKQGVWMLAAVPALVAGWTDWRWRRIPNWLTVPALLLGIAVNCFAAGWAGGRESLLGAGLGLGLWLPCLRFTCRDRSFHWIIPNLRRYRLAWRWLWR